MKKSVIILIGVIYLASIFVVGFFGAKVKAFTETIYITKIECTNEGIVDIGEYRQIKFKYNPNGNVEDNTMIITYKVLPEDATMKGKEAVQMICEPKPKEGTYSQDDLTLTFYKPKQIIYVTLQSLDGSGIKENLKINVY